MRNSPASGASFRTGDREPRVQNRGKIRPQAKCRAGVGSARRAPRSEICPSGFVVHTVAAEPSVRPAVRLAQIGIFKARVNRSTSETEHLRREGFVPRVGDGPHDHFLLDLSQRRTQLHSERAFRATARRWKSRRLGGRPRIDREIRDLIRRMNNQNPLWGAPRIHSELLMLGIEVAQSTVARYMTKRQGPPSQGWKTFLRNHAAGIASIDLFVVRTVSFKLLRDSHAGSAHEQGDPFRSTAMLHRYHVFS